MLSKELHTVDHFFRRPIVDQCRQSSDLLADRTALIRDDDDTEMSSALSQALAMQKGEIAHVPRKGESGSRRFFMR
jgi:hypothetical protein